MDDFTLTAAPESQTVVVRCRFAASPTAVFRADTDEGMTGALRRLAVLLPEASAGTDRASCSPGGR